MTDNPVYFQSIWNLSREDRRKLIAQWLFFLLPCLEEHGGPENIVWNEVVLLCPMKGAISATEFVEMAPKLFGRVAASKLFWLLASEDLVFPDKIGKNTAFRVANIKHFCNEILNPVGGDHGLF